ncbi:transketolase [bacterium]|nr:transketolase [bacterium]
MSMKQTNENLAINTIRFLAIEAVEKANSGHPGMPLGAAPMAFALWQNFIQQNPTNPQWFNRDRFVLSAGHASALLYSLLHCYGFDLSIDDLKNFRQWGSKTPGHPEVGHTPGVEATTGPLGQGIGMAVGMAMAEEFLAEQFNKPDFNIIEHYTYAIVSDGDLMEGISSESASLAGHLNLKKLICLYDDNEISIEGPTSIAFTEDTKKRFESFGWDVVELPDGNDVSAIVDAVNNAKLTDKPSLIKIRTEIGHGSPKANSESSHGSPLGKEAMQQTRNHYNWDYPEFTVPEETKDVFGQVAENGKKSESTWNTLFSNYKKKYPELGLALKKAIAKDFDPENIELPTYDVSKIATRAASGKVLNTIEPHFPTLVGGSADLAPSNNTFLNNAGIFKQDKAGKNVRFGVREHAMGAALNGMALHGGILPYGGTFLIFSDYMRASIRLSALMNTNVVYIFTHDSVGLGEDGPTHQPIEQLMSLRLIPGLSVIRPADAIETNEAWRYALSGQGPVAILLTRQGLPVMNDKKALIEDLFVKGAYPLYTTPHASEHPLQLIASGSEVSLCMEAAKELESKGIPVQVISVPCWELLKRQSKRYRSELFPSATHKIVVEAGITTGWGDIVGPCEQIGINSFGASAPGPLVMENYGFSVKNIIETAETILSKELEPVA